MTKLCSKCRRRLPTTDFHRNRTAPDGFQSHCNDCRRIYATMHREVRRASYHTPAQVAKRREYRKSPSGQAVLQAYYSREDVQQSKRNRALRRKYGIDADAFSALLSQQGGRCRVCRRSLVVGGPRLPLTATVDHDHTTGRIRGILCHQCNVGLGDFQDNAAVLRRAAAYIEGAQL